MSSGSNIKKKKDYCLKAFLPLFTTHKNNVSYFETFFIKNIHNTSVFDTVRYLFNNRKGVGLCTKLPIFIGHTLVVANMISGKLGQRNEFGEGKPFFFFFFFLNRKKIKGNKEKDLSNEVDFV